MTVVLLFRGAAATPVVANDSFVISESASLAQFTNVAASEAFALSESPTAIAVTASRNDSAAFAEAIQSIALSGPSDAATLAEIAALTIQENKVASEIYNLSEVYSLQANLSRVDAWALTELTGSISAAIAANDAGTLADASALSTLDLKSASDALTLAEAAVLLITENMSASDASTLAEAVALSAAISGLDSWTVAEAASILATLAASDSWALSEFADRQSVDLKTASDSWAVTEAVTSILTTDLKTASDNLTLSSEVAGINATVTAADLLSLLENSAVNAALLRSDAWGLTELSAKTVTDFRQASDAATLAESLGLTANVGASDTSALAEAIAELADTTFKLAADSFLLDEDSSIHAIVAITASDAFTLSAEVAGVVEYIEAPYIHHREPLDGIVSEVLTHGTVLVLVDQHGLVVDMVAHGTEQYKAAGDPTTPPVMHGTVADAVAQGTAVFHSDADEV